jgi:hypothetical protein
MSPQHDPDHDDLNDIAERLRAARPQPTAPELDGMWQTVRRRTAGGASQARVRVRGHLMATLLTVGLVFAMGSSAVIASTALTGGSQTTYTSYTQPKDAGFCQYNDPYTKTFTGTTTKGSSAATLTVTYDCTTKTFCIYSSKGISNYTVYGMPKVEVKTQTTKICFTLSTTPQSVTVKSGTTSYTFVIPKS